MGIFAESEGRDIALLSEIAELSLQSWRSYCKNHPESANFEVEINHDSLGTLSSIGDNILATHFPHATILDRIATFLVLANSCPFFRLRHPDGRPVYNIAARRDFLAKFTCGFIATALWSLKSSEEGFYRFTGFKEERVKQRFFAFLQLLDAGEVSPSSIGKKEQEAHAIKTYARDVVAVVNFLEPGLVFVPGADKGDVLEIEF